MNRLLIALLVVSIAGNVVGMYFAYKYIKTSRRYDYQIHALLAANNTVESLTDKLDGLHPYRMVFLHHSVGQGILDQGGLRDSLMGMGIVVKGATYGDEIGQQTDMNHWASKFTDDMDRILSFKSHPDRYYTGGQSNDIVMFKSCYPNSEVVAAGTEPGDPFSSERSLTNYKATFANLIDDMKAKPKKLFIYVTAPPQVPSVSSPSAAALARQFNQWVSSDYLALYQEQAPAANLVVFDLFDLLADDAGFLKSDYRKAANTEDSHPNELANKQAAISFMEFFRPKWEAWQQQSETN